MAATLKCTKLSNTGVSLLVSEAYDVRVDYVDPTTTPPTPGTVICQVSFVDSGKPEDYQSAIDATFTGLSLDTIDWTL